MAPNKKWKFAIGTTSRVPKSNRHYLILDVDITDSKTVALVSGILTSLGITTWMFQKTPNGFHVYTGKTYSWSYLLRVMRLFPLDKKWLSIGRSRGYFYLADKDEVLLPWPVERMVLRWREKEHPKN